MGKTNQDTEEVARRKQPQRGAKQSKPQASRPPPPQRSQAQSSTRKSKGKQIAVESSDSESENDEVPTVREPRSKPPTHAELNSRPPPTYDEKYAKLKVIKFVPTRFPDLEFLTLAGLYQDVEAMLANMGLFQFTMRPCDTYVELCREFFSSLKIKNHDPRKNETDEVGYIEFTVGGTTYRVSLGEISNIYDLPRGRYTELDVPNSELVDVWDFIGVGHYKDGSTKATNIRHPTIRYIHKILSHTLFARKEKGAISVDELDFIIIGLKPFLSFLNNGCGLHANRNDMSMAAYFTKQLHRYRLWMWSTTDATPQFSFGGLLTPLFIHKGIELRGPKLASTRIDALYLRRAFYLEGTLNTSYAYKYHVSRDKTKIILLPQLELTTLLLSENVAFDHGEEHLYNAKKHGILDKILATGKSEKSQPRHGGEASHEDTSSPPPSPPRVYGSSRYDFQPFEDPIHNPVVRQAHEHINILQRFIKWQGRSLKKVVEQVKGLKKKVKNLEAKIPDVGCSHPPREEVVDSVADEATNMEEGIEGRHSYHGTLSLALAPIDPHRASSYERRQRRKRRAPRSPTPVPDSSNSSYSFSSASFY